MVELIIEETGFPKNRETLKELQDSFAVPINEILNALPGNRILSGFEVSGGGGSANVTEGVVLYKGKLWTVEAATGALPVPFMISFFEAVENLTFNVGTQTNPSYEERPGKIRRSAKIGTLPGRVHLERYTSFQRNRKFLEYLKTGSVFVGPVVVSNGAAIYHINFGGSIGTKDFHVLGTFRAADPEINFTRAFTWDINNRTVNGFDVIINSVTNASVPLIFDYTVVPIDRRFAQEP